jgi:hypothetical protein
MNCSAIVCPVCRRVGSASVYRVDASGKPVWLCSMRCASKLECK